MNKSEAEALALWFIKSAIDGQRLSRFDLGCELYLGHLQSNKWRKKSISMTSYLSYISTLYPTISKRSLMRHYRVHEKLVVRSGISIFTLMDIDFTTLALAAEDRCLPPPSLRDVISKLHTMVMNGASQKEVRRQFNVYAERTRANIPRLLALIEECDERIVSGYYSKEEEPE
ncbi:hypothetical protein ES708_09858 [subsurface metagenome]